MASGQRLTVTAVALLFFVFVGWEHWGYAQEYQREGGAQRFEEEDLPPDSQGVTSNEEFVEDGADEEYREPGLEEEEFPQRDPYAGPSAPSAEDPPSFPSNPDVTAEPDQEEPQIETSGPPSLPPAHLLPPREQVALSFVTAGMTAMDKEDMTQARILFERAMEIAPLQPYSYFFLGRLALSRGEHQKALPLLRKAEVLLMRGDPAWRSETMSAQGAVHEDLGEIPQARQAYRRSLQFSQQNLRAMSALARLAGEEPDSDDVASP